MRVCSKNILFNLSSRLASNDTIDSVLRHRELGRAKDLSAPGNIKQLLKISSLTMIRRWNTLAETYTTWLWISHCIQSGIRCQYKYGIHFSL